MQPPRDAAPHGAAWPPVAACAVAGAPPPGERAARIEQVLAWARGPAARAVFTELLPEDALAAARAADAAAQAPGPRGALHPLAGLPVTVKDLFDIAGRTTRAGSRLREQAAPARADAPAVARLRAAGAAIVGRTNMSEFAFSGVGLNPHFGTPRNPFDLTTARVPGGSSSGAAVSVALGLAVGALGSDTGGSIRIPAALCGLVGFKNTQRRTPREGAFPLSNTLDTVCAMANTVADCLLLDGVIAGAPLAVRPRGARSLRVALPRGGLLLEGLDETVARAWARALGRLAAAGVELVELELPEVEERSALRGRASFAPAEAFAVHRETLSAHRAEYDPRVARRIAMGQEISAADYIVLHEERRAWIARMRARLAGFDALACPTVPVVAPEMAPLVADDEAFFAANGLLLRNPSLINFLDGCAFTLPMHDAGELPCGLMLSAAGGEDAALAAVALALEPLLRGGSA